MLFLEMIALYLVKENEIKSKRGCKGVSTLKTNKKKSTTAHFKSNSGQRSNEVSFFLLIDKSRKMQ